VGAGQCEGLIFCESELGVLLSLTGPNRRTDTRISGTAAG